MRDEDRGRARQMAGVQWKIVMLPLVVALPLVVQPVLGQGPEALFPQAFEVEHHAVQTAEDGSVFMGESVVDTYGGSWIVSQRRDGNRVVIDLARREITEVRMDSGSYTVIGFDQMAELQRRLQRAELMQVGIVPGEAAAERAGAGKDERGQGREPRLVVEQVEVQAGLEHESSAAKAMIQRQGVQRQGVQRLQVRVASEQSRGSGEGEAVVEVWLDPTVRLGQPALEALSRFEAEVLGATAAAGEVPMWRYMAAARGHGKGAFAVRTRRPILVRGQVSQRAAVEDVVTRLERLDAFPVELVSVPEGYRRVVHPLEQMVAFAEEEGERNLRALQATR